MTEPLSTWNDGEAKNSVMRLSSKPAARPPQKQYRSRNG